MHTFQMLITTIIMQKYVEKMSNSKLCLSNSDYINPLNDAHTHITNRNMIEVIDRQNNLWEFIGFATIVYLSN